MRSLLRSALTAVAVFSVSACGPMGATDDGGSTQNDSGFLINDSGSLTDAGATVDAGAPDSGSTTDAGSGSDAGQPSDAGFDAGQLTDAGQPSDGGRDAGPVADAGVEIVRLRTQPCERPVAAATRCESYEVTCAGAAPAVVDVTVYEPAVGITKKGIIMFGSGGAGTGYYNFRQRNQLTAQGFTTLERRWVANQGWFEGASQGPAQGSCRLAALMRHFKATLAPTGLACATGNSGGSAELTYALTWHNLGASLDFAMPSSGPFHRLDLGCKGQSDTAWVAECAALKASRCPDCDSNTCQLGAGIINLIDASFAPAPRCSAPGTGDLALLQAGSPIYGPSISSLGSLPIHFLGGKLDNGPFAPFAIALSDALNDAGVNTTMQFVNDAGHEMDQYQTGADTILNELLANCR